jgi:DNA-binding NarL/FixJ family response regulator
MKPDAITLIEAAYDLDAQPAAWLAAVADRAMRYVAGALAVVSYDYRIGQDGRVVPGASAGLQVTDDILKHTLEVVGALPPDYVRETFVRTPCGLATEAGPPDTREYTRAMMRQQFSPFGWEDFVVINGIDPTGLGVYFGIAVGPSVRISPAARTRWSRVAAHLAAANRLRHRLANGPMPVPGGADALLTTSGRIEHATGDAKSAEALARLRAGARAIDRARGKLRKSEPDAAVAEWRGLIATRWTLLDHFESDGKRYLLARRNEPTPPGLDSLAPRERQALGFASLGHTNKLIAYEMGISASTVSVLLCRAGKKLQARSRAALIAAFRAATAHK